MGARFYRGARKALRLFTKRLTTTWEVPFDGEPCIFLCNHDRASGPIRIVTDFPLMDDCRIWIWADALDRKSVPAYVRQDHWWNEKGPLAPVWNAVVPPVVALLLPPILNSVPHVPVFHDIRTVTTVRESLRALKDEKRHLVIFPEIPTGFREHEPRKIKEGFLMILEYYYKRTGRTLKMWPIHFDSADRAFRVKAPVVWDPSRSVQEQIPELSRQILDSIFEQKTE